MTFARVAVLSIALSATAAAPVPVLRFAIDQDYAPQTESVARVAQDFPLVRALSIGILRTGIGWDDTNPARNTYNWPYWSRITSERQHRTSRSAPTTPTPPPGQVLPTTARLPMTVPMPKPAA